MKLTVDVFNNQTRVGVISFEKDAPFVQDESDDKFVQVVRRSLVGGIERAHDIWEGQTKTIVREPTKPGDPGFALAFIEWLRRHGYDVREQHPEVDAEIQTLLSRLPDDQPLKAKVLKELPSMNYLEKTLILEVLRDDIDPSELQQFTKPQ